MTISETDIQTELDRITDVFDDKDTFISVELTERNVFLVTLKELSPIVKLVGNQTSIRSSIDGTKKIFNIHYETGPQIKFLLGDDTLHTPFSKKIDVINQEGSLGGDEVRNQKKPNSYGTISFYANSIELDYSGRCSGTCKSKKAMVSNNHVIARADRGKKGEKLSTGLGENTAQLKCFIRYSCRSDTDIAIASVNNFSKVKPLTIRDVGKIKGFRRPKMGESVRKYGARTGLTKGKVTGRKNVQAEGHTFRKAYRLSGGFACAGDSGSAVIAESDGKCVGLIFAGEKKDCDQDPLSYMFTFVRPGELQLVHLSDFNVVTD